MRCSKFAVTLAVTSATIPGRIALMLVRMLFNPHTINAETIQRAISEVTFHAILDCSGVNACILGSPEQEWSCFQVLFHTTHNITDDVAVFLENRTG